LSIIPFVCHFSAVYQETRTTQPLAQQIEISTVQNPALTELGRHFSWPGQVVEPKPRQTEPSPLTQAERAVLVNLAPPEPPDKPESCLPAARPLHWPASWCGSLAYCAQAPPRHA
jgi:hypothetical protein